MAVLRMARPTTRANTANVQFRRVIPADIRRALAKLPDAYRPRGWGKAEITISTGTADRRTGAAEHARIAADVEERFAKLRAGTMRLSQKDATALAGEMYRAFADGAEDDPGTVEQWRGVQKMNADAKAGRFGVAALMIGEEASRRHAMEERFGIWADGTLASKCIVTDPESRWRLVEALADAMNDAAARLERNAGGDYTPDPKAARFPAWADPRAARGPSDSRGKLTLADLFDRWRKHPEQAGQAAHTVSRYEGVISALATFLNNPDARAVTNDDVHRYVEARMSPDAKPKPLEPRVVRDVHKAAISSVFKWAVAKKHVATNPAADITIKVPKKRSLRPKDATADEARTIADACIAIPNDAVAGTFDAAKRWCILIAIYTGARIGEVTQLRREDVTETKHGLMMRITPEAGTVKSGEYRDVPLHSRIANLGFGDFVAAAADGPLFYPHGERRNAQAVTPQSELVARQLATWSRENGLGDPLLTRPLHALRHRFRTEASRAGIAAEYVRAIAGWSQGSDMSSRYGQFPVEVLRREISKLRPESVEGRGE